MKKNRGVITKVLISLAVFALTAAGQKHQLSSEQAPLDFLKQYWQVPIPLQGKPPAGWSQSEVSLAPESCGGCHPQQFNDWKTTVHGRAVGPGLLGQTPTLLKTDAATARICYQCHAPLQEQQEIIFSGARVKKNSHFDLSLQGHGLMCAACHVRANQRFGPPRRDGSLVDLKPRDRLPHRGVTRTPAFERAEFCMGCHQFESDGNRLNGKLLENTYNEWKSGPYAAQGIQCQQCHMPDRRHLWRGIHDPEMVKSGVKMELELNQPTYNIGDKLEATLTLSNTGVGHYFPTYVTPKIVLRMELIDSTSQVIPDSIKEETIGRQVTLDLEREIADTRIPPKGVHTFQYARTIDRPGMRLHAEIIVYPDDFYARFYEAKLKGRLSRIERQQLLRALDDARKSVYKLLDKDRSL